MNAFVKIPANKASLARRKKVFGVGVNNSNYKVRYADGKQQVLCPAYMKWHNMLRRCYSDKLHERLPAYKDATVCDEWLRFSVFERWLSNNNINGWHLDKDIKHVGNKIYSPSTCLLVPLEINGLVIKNESRRGKYKIGACYDKSRNKYYSSLSIDGANVKLGRFDSENDAHNAYKLAKNAEVMRKCEQYPQFAKYLINHLM